MNIFLRFIEYQKSTNQTIDAITADLRKMRDEISNLKPNEGPTNFIISYILIHNCQGPEYDIPKYMLAQKEPLTSHLIIKRLRSIEQNKISKNSDLAARQRRNNRSKTSARTKSSGGQKN